MLDASLGKPVRSRITMTSAAIAANAVRVGRPVWASLLLAGGLLLVPGPNCTDEGIGDPCTPEQEFDETFLGFDAKEVNVESKSFQCRTRLCLVHHFQGRVSCKYGQDSTGNAPSGAEPCKLPGNTDKGVVGAKDEQGNFVDPRRQSRVDAQCVDRAAAKAVYCSCRCADINGERPSDQNFCDCPDGFTCERLVTSIGQGNEGLTGSYCIYNNTKYDPTTACSQGTCDPNDPKRKCD